MHPYYTLTRIPEVGVFLCAGIAVAGLIAISLCLTVTILELLKLKREAREEAAQKEEAAKGLDGASFRHSHSHQVRGHALFCVCKTAWCLGKC
jgi:hypothetical protein